jgi:hypothetical protein
MARRGRPKGSKNKATLKAEFDKELLREELRLKVREHIGPLVDAQIANAQGIKYLVLRHAKSGKFIKRIEDATGEIKLDPDNEIIEVWAKDPSVQAFTDLMNRTIDKPAETVNQEVTHTIKVYKWKS